MLAVAIIANESSYALHCLPLIQIFPKECQTFLDCLSRGGEVKTNPALKLALLVTKIEARTGGTQQQSLALHQSFTELNIIEGSTRLMVFQLHESDSTRCWPHPLALLLVPVNECLDEIEIDLGYGEVLLEDGWSTSRAENFSRYCFVDERKGLA